MATLSTQKIIGIVLVAGPTALLIVSALGTTLANIIYQTQLGEPVPTLMSFFIGRLGALGGYLWFPAMIAGIVLLAVKDSKKPETKGSTKK